MLAVNDQDRIIKPHRQTVRIDGSITNLIKCTDCDSQSASFKIPAARFDSKTKKDLHGKMVSVEVNNRYLFTGFINTSNAQVTPDNDGFSFSAQTVTTKLSFIYVGQGENKNVVKYPITSGITTILQDLFNKMPIYGGTILLGDTSVIDDGEFLFEENFVFRNSTYASALDTLVAYMGDIAYNVRPFSGGVYIDFYKLGGDNNGTSFANLADYGDDVVFSTVQDLDENIASADKIDAVTVWGTPKKCIISVYSTVPAEDPTLWLQKAWLPSLEPLVLAFPDAAKRDNPAYRPGCEFVFKRYRLPAVLTKNSASKILMLKDLPIEKVTPDGNKQNYQNQAFLWSTTMVLPPDPGSNIASIGQWNTTPEIVDCKFDLENGYVIFSEPTLGLTQVEIVTDPEGKLIPKKTYGLAPCGITIAVEHLDHVMSYTTPTNEEWPNTLSVLKEELGWVGYTNIGLPFDGKTFPPVTVFWEDTTPAQIATVSTPVVLKDDSASIQKLAQEILKERRNVSKEISFTAPFITTAFRPGNKLIIRGSSEWNGDELTVTDVNYNLDTYRTSVTANTTKPMKVSSASS